jgi:peroxiredoxin
VIQASSLLPIPARFVISQAGLIRYAEANPDYTQRPEPEAMLDAIRG